ncbi:hypothetical protein IAQ61_004795 [Plenodomus lingam]|uniref:Uncharacterized protein n=1 Tax=Leptosphaeria maculans (strain JN3 / isolate v23.1.3 / race Av1-4-5-6-7-8) TaxID=985895 RepID=E4ZWJ3_LEPMJ|nr:hypothetical protein LEMA_P031210.1 [Plenodomus lingam JN3]KAH9874166.1 hypothetical protein IAQ61_004795 [Plenodomus lingam]CBX95969.1 hypothetical protein LEMA_P031210.1 [Plenodomus lingam JN3]
MHYSTLISSTLLATAAATAIPGLTRRDPLTKRAEKTWDPNGNLKLTFSSETVKIGSLSIDDIIAKIYEVCHETGQCETSTIDMKSMLLSSETATALKVSIDPAGSYPTWIRNGLVDALAAATKAVAKCTQGTHTNTCAGSTAMAYCPRRKTKYTNCEVPKYWGVNFQDPKEANAAPPSMGLDVAVEEAGDAAACEDAMAGLGAVAGAVHGVGGGIFTLLTFACT